MNWKKNVKGELDKN